MSWPERLHRGLVRAESGCLEWQGGRVPYGYGRMSRGGRGQGMMLTHRASWELSYGPVPDGLYVCHRCDNPPCCEPTHLFLGTHADNMADKVSKGRQVRGETARLARFTDGQIRDLRALAASGLTAKDVATRVGCSRQTVYDVLSGKSRVSTR